MVAFSKKNQIAIMSNGLLEYKTWPIKKIQKLINKLKGKYHFVQIGQDTDEPLKNVLDMRGKLDFRQIAALLYNSDCFVCGIGGLMHLARTVKCPCVIAASLSQPAYLDSYPGNRYIYPQKACDLCGKNLHHLRLPCKDNYSCVRNIRLKDMICAVCELMNNPPKIQPYSLEIHSSPIRGVELLKLYLNCMSALTDGRYTPKAKWKSLKITENEKGRCRIYICNIKIFSYRRKKRPVQ